MMALILRDTHLGITNRKALAQSQTIAREKDGISGMALVAWVVKGLNITPVSPMFKWRKNLLVQYWNIDSSNRQSGLS